MIEILDRYRETMGETLPGAGASRVDLMKVEPKITFGRWNDEIQMGVRYQGLNVVGLRALGTDRVEWTGVTESLHAYPLLSKAGMEDGGFEIEVILPAAPPTNVFNFTIDGAQSLDFFFQPALTAPELALGWVRPANVVGSYAVYHKTKRDGRPGSTHYGTGKAFHIYRPEAIDALGQRVWCDLAYTAPTLSVTVPLDFLASATYPIRVDPTFGYTTIGGSSGSSAHGPPELFVCLFTSPSDFGTATEMSIYLRHASTSSNAKAAIYSDSSGPSALLASTAEQSINTTAAWRNFTISYVGAASTNYWLASYLQDGAINVYWDSGTTDQLRVRGTGLTYGTLPDPFGTADQTFAFKQSIYVTYTAAGGDEQIPIRRIFAIPLYS